MSQNNPLTALIDAKPFILLDGAMATELEARGCNLADSLWSAKVLVDNPELIREVHLDYFRAGAQVAITASYQATPAGFAALGLDEAQSKALIGKSVELARKAREAYLAENPQAGALLVAGAADRLSARAGVVLVYPARCAASQRRHAAAGSGWGAGKLSAGGGAGH